MVGATQLMFSLVARDSVFRKTELTDGDDMALTQ